MGADFGMGDDLGIEKFDQILARNIENVGCCLGGLVLGSIDLDYSGSVFCQVSAGTFGISQYLAIDNINDRQIRSMVKDLGVDRVSWIHQRRRSANEVKRQAISGWLVGFSNVERGDRRKLNG